VENVIKKCCNVCDVLLSVFVLHRLDRQIIEAGDWYVTMRSASKHQLLLQIYVLHLQVFMLSADTQIFRIGYFFPARKSRP
jgi:hypothetical protein